MRIERSRLSTAWRRLLLALVSALGIGAIVGSGGVGFMPDFNLGDVGNLSPAVAIAPTRPVVQVGATVSFASQPMFVKQPIAYQWRRNGVAITGATGASHALVGANLADDGAVFEVTVTAANGEATAGTLLRVSSAPGIVFQDGDFAVADWTVTSIAVTPSDGPTHSASREATGGDPDAFRSILYQMPRGPSSARLFHMALNATYEPAQQGAVYAIDMELDCNRVRTTTSSETLLGPAFEQGGRRFVPQRWDEGCAPLWQLRRQTGLLANDFIAITGPACAAAEACPDFSLSAAPIRFGFASTVNLASDTAAGSVTQGVDNWRVTVWRR